MFAPCSFCLSLLNNLCHLQILQSAGDSAEEETVVPLFFLCKRNTPCICGGKTRTNGRFEKRPTMTLHKMTNRFEQRQSRLGFFQGQTFGWTVNPEDPIASLLWPKELDQLISGPVAFAIICGS